MRVRRTSRNSSTQVARSSPNPKPSIHRAAGLSGRLGAPKLGLERAPVPRAGGSPGLLRGLRGERGGSRRSLRSEQNVVASGSQQTSGSLQKQNSVSDPEQNEVAPSTAGALKRDEERTRRVQDAYRALASVPTGRETLKNLRALKAGLVPTQANAFVGQISVDLDAPAEDDDRGLLEEIVFGVEVLRHQRAMSKPVTSMSRDAFVRAYLDAFVKGSVKAARFFAEREYLRNNPKANDWEIEANSRSTLGNLLLERMYIQLAEQSGLVHTWESIWDEEQSTQGGTPVA